MKIELMSINAPIHDLLIRIKNAYMARRRTVSWVWYSNFAQSVLTLLKQYKFIEWFEVIDGWNNKRFITVALKEIKNPVQDIPVIRFFSKPSRRRYVSYKDLKPVAWWQGIWIISTSKGLLPSHEAKKQKVWGELIAEIY